MSIDPVQAQSSQITPKAIQEIAAYNQLLRSAPADSPSREIIENQIHSLTGMRENLLKELKPRLAAGDADTVINQQVQQYLARFDSSNAAAERRQLSPDEFEAVLKQQAYLNLVIESTVGKGVKAEQRQIEEAKSALDQVSTPSEQLILEQLIFPVAPDEDATKLATIRSAADDAHTKLSAPSSSFSGVAIEYAANPYFARYQKLPALTLNELTPELARALSSAAEGSLSNPVRSSYGIHLVRVIKRIKPEPTYDQIDLNTEAQAIKLREAIGRTLKDIARRRLG